MRRTLVATMAMLFACLPAAAQTNANKGSIGGFVSSTNGDPIPQARVAALSTVTGLSRETLTNTAGF